MDFFAAQELRRKKTKWLVLMYAAAIALITIGIYAVIAVALAVQSPPGSDGGIGFFNPIVFGIVALVNILVIGGASLYKTSELRSGGQHIASMMGGVRVPASTTDLAERRLLNVVEEMALASRCFRAAGLHHGQRARHQCICRRFIHPQMP